MLLASSPLLIAGASLLVLGLAFIALRCVGLAVSLWPYDAALSALAGTAALVLGGGAVGAALHFAGRTLLAVAG